MKNIDEKMREATRIVAALSEELGHEQDLAQLQEVQSRLQKKRLRVQKRLFRRSREPHNNEL
jgi:hypothetical protein